VLLLFQESALSISRSPLGLLRNLHLNGIGEGEDQMPVQPNESLWVGGNAVSYVCLRQFIDIFGEDKSAIAKA
jgi:hypothetical protein